MREHCSNRRRVVVSGLALLLGPVGAAVQKSCLWEWLAQGAMCGLIILLCWACLQLVLVSGGGLCVAARLLLRSMHEGMHAAISSVSTSAPVAEACTVPQALVCLSLHTACCRLASYSADKRLLVRGMPLDTKLWQRAQVRRLPQGTRCFGRHVDWCSTVV